MAKENLSYHDHIGINEALFRYCHGLDRRDLETLKSAFWEDGTDDHGGGPVPAFVFAAGVLESLSVMRSTQHVVSNVMVNPENEARARVQSYMVAYHQIEAETGGIEMVLGGRYLDLVEKRGEIWRI